MKKHTLLLSGTILFLALGNTGLKAQITIMQADMPTTTSKAVMAVDNTGSLMPQNASLSSQTWNYSALQNSQTNQYLFVNPSSTPYFAYFPSSNLADSLIYAPGYTYLQSTPSAFLGLGIGEVLMGFSVGLALHPAYTQITLPATLGTTDGGMSRGDTAIKYMYLFYDSVGAIINIHYADTVDAWGSMTTPYGTQNVIRQKHWDITVDTLRGHTGAGWAPLQITTTKNYIYRWYANGMPYYFATMQMDHTNSHDSVVQWFDGTNLGIDKISNSTYTSVYPNPCQTEITFNCSAPQAKQVSVFDITGRQLSSQEIKNAMVIMNTSAYSQGMYFYRVSDISGNIIDRGKFIVQ
jgi:hypothetical protein